MTRCAGLLVVLLSLTSTAEAATGARHELMPRPDSVPVRSTTPAPAPAASSQEGQFKLTADTEVLLDGKMCAFRDIPKDAVIVRIEVAEDRKTVLRIEFRMKK